MPSNLPPYLEEHEEDLKTALEKKKKVTHHYVDENTMQCYNCGHLWKQRTEYHAEKKCPKCGA